MLRRPPFKRALALAVAAGLGFATWLREPAPGPNFELALQLTPLDLGPGGRRIGPFKLSHAWQLRSPNDDFGGYSALVRPAEGRLLALTDRGYFLDFAEPGAKAGAVRIGPVLANQALLKHNRDVEAAAWDPASGQLWLALEGRNAVIRQHLDMRPLALRAIPEWSHWGSNTGPEAMVRLRDGRFVVLCECFTGWFEDAVHPGFLYTGDPSAGSIGQAFSFVGAAGYRPTDVAELPDGRVLIVMRRLVWPAPARFAAKLMLADPAQIVPGQPWQAIELADLSAPLPVDNFEALAVEPRADGSITAWLMSDDNEAVSQRTLLWQLDFRLSDLPPKQKAPG